MISLKSILCCQLAEEEENLDRNIKDYMLLIMRQQERLSQLITKRDACAMVRKHLLEGK